MLITAHYDHAATKLWDDFGMAFGSRRSTRSPRSRFNRAGIYGAIILTVLVYSGQLKATILFSWMPFDLTIIASVLVAVSMVRSRVIQGKATGFIVLPILLWIIFVIPLSYTSPGGDAGKVAILFTITLLIAVSPFYLLRTAAQRNAFLWSTAITGIIVAIIVMSTGTTVVGFDSRFILAGTDTIGTARVAGAAAIVCLLFSMARGRSVQQRLLLMLSGIVLMALTLATGSRGPVLAAVMAVIAVVCVSPTFKKYRVRVAASIAIIGTAAFWVASARSADGASRLMQFVSGTGSSPDLGREEMASEAWSQINANPLGIGWGNFSAYGGIFTYPHDLFLEVPMEGGWLAGVAVVLLLVTAAIRYFVIEKDNTQLVMHALLLFSALNAAVSSDINGNRLLWVTMFAAFAVSSIKRETMDPDELPFTRQKAQAPSLHERLHPATRR